MKIATQDNSYPGFYHKAQANAELLLSGELAATMNRNGFLDSIGTWTLRYVKLQSTATSL